MSDDKRISEKELATLKAFTKQLSNALLKVRPLGGSEMFVERCGEYYADPDYCGKMIEQLRATLDMERRERIRNEKVAAKWIESERLDAMSDTASRPLGRT